MLIKDALLESTCQRRKVASTSVSRNALSKHNLVRASCNNYSNQQLKPFPSTVNELTKNLINTSVIILVFIQ